MCLTTTQFYALTEMQQMRAVSEMAVVVGERREDGFHYVLYNIEGLYVEETRSYYDEDFFYYSCIEDTDRLLPYTDEIEIVFL